MNIWLHFPATAAAALAAAPILLLLLVLLRLEKRFPDRKTPWHGRTEKHQNCAQKVPNVTFEATRKSSFWVHFPTTAAAALAAAPTASALGAAPARKALAGQENTMARKNGKAPKFRLKTT